MAFWCGRPTGLFWRGGSGPAQSRTGGVQRPGKTAARNGFGTCHKILFRGGDFPSAGGQNLVYTQSENRYAWCRPVWAGKAHSIRLSTRFFGEPPRCGNGGCFLGLYRLHGSLIFSLSFIVETSAIRQGWQATNGRLVSARSAALLPTFLSPQYVRLRPGALTAHSR